MCLKTFEDILLLLYFTLVRWPKHHVTCSVLWWFVLKPKLWSWFDVNHLILPRFVGLSELSPLCSRSDMFLIYSTITFSIDNKLVISSVNADREVHSVPDPTRHWTCLPVDGGDLRREEEHLNKKKNVTFIKFYQKVAAYFQPLSNKDASKQNKAVCSKHLQEFLS